VSGAGTFKYTLSIHLDKAYLGSDLVDSAFAIWELNGSQTRFLLEKSNEALTANTSKLQAGNGTLTVKIFSRVKFGVFLRLNGFLARR
jgi:hypothetical protein